MTVSETYSLEQKVKSLQEEKLREINIGVEWFKMYEKNKEIVSKIREWVNVNQVKSGWNGQDIVEKIKEILGDES